jgi:3D (Asp-Asp-Asp) domain-containing protein
VACALVIGVMLSAPAGGGADPTTTPLELRQQSESLDARVHHALLDLYSAETQLASARSRLAELRGQAARVRAEQQLVRRQFSIAAHALRVSQRRLADRLRVLYEQGSEPDPLAIILGSSSLDEVITSLDALHRNAQQNQQVIDQTTSTRRVLERLAARLADRSDRLGALQQQAAASTRELEGVRAERAGLVESLRTKQRLTQRTIASLQVAAAAAEVKTETLAATEPSTETTQTVTDEIAPVASTDLAPTTLDGVRSITVSATGYSLSGRTATGLPVGIGVVAVDPSVIPLGTHLTIPGYGEAVAADTGSAVQGATIDLWFPTLAQARAWGRRTVTITLH